jgi:cytoskeleton protein RodZ
MELGIGAALRDARRRLGCSLTDAADDTKIRESYLAALEQEEFAGLGSDVYVRGFITSYARYLRLDPEPLLDVYRTHRSDAEPRGSARHGMRSVPGAQSPRERPAGAALLLALLGLLVVALLAFALRGGGESAALGAVALLPVVRVRR